ncbi:BTAD domain-containing putative transcriptional regulator [Kribbella sp. NPDC048928]|uniref:BTAD domain-containing putative transcriptional regulator n=1 Tax=Kribbella sp. NPDC048928 TaxID=3364111 RepID=UPI0037226419
MEHLDIRLLGPFEIRRDGQVLRVPGAKVRALLAMLALNCGRTVSPTALGAALWTDDPPQRLRGSLQTYVGRLRRVLGDDAIATEPTGYRLDLPSDSVDVLRFHRLLDDGKTQQALGLWRGDPFGSALSPWFEEHEAPALVERYLTAWEQLPDAGIPELQKLTTRYPLRETLWLRLFEALRDAGRSAEALDRYEAFRTQLADELGADPAPELQAMHRSLLVAQPPTPKRPPPHDLTRFFGRDKELAELDRSLRDSRLVTIAGPPGAGKTRLSREAAAQIGSRFAAGVVHVELVSTSPGALLTTITEDADVLVVLDNCEHVVDEARAAALQLLATYPSVRILATSRIPLGATGERVYRLPPLAHRTAVELFTDRARLVNAAFTFDDTVHQICQRLDGLPLAIELAAAWSRVLSARQILDRLTPLLHAPHGHQLTMRAALDASYRLLQPPQQQLFGRLAVFTDGFDLEALEAVAGHDEALTALVALVDHSLVLTESLPDGRRRFRLLEPVRQYAVTVFEDDRSNTAVRERHARHYLTVVLRDDIRLRGPDRAAAVVDLQREEANLLAALRWAREQPTDLALRLSTALGYYSEHRGQVNEARVRIEEVLDLAPTEPKVLAAACARLGRLAWRQRDYPAARAAYHRSLVLRRQLGDEDGTARSLRDLALVTASSGEPHRAAELCEQSIAMFLRAGDERGLGWALTVLGLTLFEDSRWEEGESHYRAALEISLTGGGAAMNVTARLGIAFAAAVAGDVATHRQQLGGVVGQISAAAGLIEDPEWLWAGMSLAANEGRTRAALRLAGAATALGRQGGRMSGTMTTFCDAGVERLRQLTGVRRATRLMAEGRDLSQADLITEALAPPTVGDRPLSDRELEVATLAGQGLSNDDIARNLYISRRTVETHLENVRRKLGFGNRYEVVAWALARSG